MSKRYTISDQDANEILMALEDRQEWLERMTETCECGCYRHHDNLFSEDDATYEASLDRVSKLIERFGP